MAKAKSVTKGQSATPPKQVEAAAPALTTVTLAVVLNDTSNAISAVMGKTHKQPGDLVALQGEIQRFIKLNHPISKTEI